MQRCRGQSAIRSEAGVVGLVLVLIAVLGSAACAPTQSATPSVADGIGDDRRGAPDLLPPATETRLAETEITDATSGATETSGEPQVSAEPSATVDASGSRGSSPAVEAYGLGCLSRRTRFAQLLLPLATQAEMGTARELAAAGDLGGVGLLGEPDLGIADALTSLQQASHVPVLVASDEEGGSVQRLAAALGPLPAAETVAATTTPAQSADLFADYAARAAELGIHVIFGPVVDVGGGPGIGSRSFGQDPHVVTDYAGAIADAMMQAGVMPVFKHFPGHGSATGDSHFGLPGTPHLDELRGRDLVPYSELVADGRRDDAGVMVGHLAVPGLSGELPASLSADAVNGLLRAEIGFGGLVFTDAMNMGAIVDTWGAAESLEMAFRAGADIAILGSLTEVVPALDHLEAAADADAGLAALLELRAERVLQAKGQHAICVGAQSE